MDKNEFYGSAVPLSQQDIERAALSLAVPPEVVAAVIQVEAASAAYFPDGRPKILFEAHIFGRLTNHRFGNVKDKTGKAVSSVKWNKALYGATGSHQYDRLYIAMGLDMNAALQSASYGAPQIMGFNYKLAGFLNVEDFVRAMVNSTGAQIMAFVSFIKKAGLADELQRKDWAGFAKGYNGAGYAENQYDVKMRQAYAALVGNWRKKYVNAQNAAVPTATPPRVLSRSDVAAAQAALNILGIPKPPLTKDGWVGALTTAAVKAFQTKNGLPATGNLNQETMKKLGL